MYDCKALPFTLLHIRGHKLLKGDMFADGRLPIETHPVPFPIKLENQETDYKVELKNLKKFLSKNMDKLFAIPITYTANPIGNNVESFLKDFAESLIEFDNIHLVFYNGQDLYGDRSNFDREQYFADSLKHFPKNRIHFYLCNVELLNSLNSKMPGVNLNFYNIYFSQIADTNSKIKNLRYTTQHRNYNVISLNSRVAKHRDDVVSILENYDTALYSYRYKGKFLENTECDENRAPLVKDPKVDYNLPQPHSLMRQYQNIIPDSIYNNAYFYVCTETDFYNEYVDEETNWEFKTKKTLSWCTEKTLKSFVYKWPMLMVGNPYTLKALRTIGFKTFPMLFDEGYDEIEVPQDRMIHIQKQIIKLCEMPLTEAHQLYYSDVVQETLEHNRNHFFKLLDTMDINKISKTLRSQYRV